MEVEVAKGNKTWVSFITASQSLVRGLLVNLLLSLSTLWHWIQQQHHRWLKDDVVETQQQQQQQQQEAVVVSVSSPSEGGDRPTHETTTTEASVAEESDYHPGIPPGETEEDFDKTIEIKEAEEEADHNSKMTIEVTTNPESGVTTAKMSLGVKYSLPIAVRLNSESLDQGSDQDEELVLEFDRKTSHSQEDSCSGYCSGSGSSLPGSPVPNTGCMEMVNVTVTRSLSSSDETEGEVVLVGNGEEKLQLQMRRDSGSSTASDISTNPEGEEGDVPEETVARLVTQVESMFSNDHLARDGFLLKHVRRRSDGFVSLKLVAGLRKVKQISREFAVVLTALKTSDKLEVNEEGTKIRRREPLTSELKSMPIKQAKKDKSEADKEKNQAEKENQQQHQHHPNGNHNGTDEQQIARKRRQKGDRLNELQYERGPQHHPNQKVHQQQPYHQYQNGRRISGRGSFSCGDENQVSRRRGGSLPVPAAALAQHRSSISGGYLLFPTTNASHQSGSAPGFLRPKSNSYSEGSDPNGSGATMSSWLQRRKASAASTRLSSGDITLTGVIRQPRGPDGTKGFHPGFRTLIIEERLQRETTQQLSAFSE